MSSYAPTVSVIIRNRNEAEHLKNVLAALVQQEYRNYEIVIVDNRSTDDSIGVAQAAKARIVILDEFTYGKALNVGIEAATGEIIVILSAHSIPLGRYFLTECVRAFEDGRVGAARLVYAGKGSDMTRWLQTEWINSVEQDFISKGPLASGCAIRRAAWEEVPFDEEVIAAEDKIWTAEILKKGYSVITPIPAFYYYCKKISPISELHKNYRELVAINHWFGWRSGFVKSGGFKAVTDFCIGVLSSFSVAVKRIHFEMIKAYLRLKFPKL